MALNACAAEVSTPAAADALKPIPSFSPLPREQRRHAKHNSSHALRERQCDCDVAATANKCLHGVPGASFVIVRRTALDRAASRTYYLDLSVSRACSTRAIRRLHRQCTRTMRWSRPCASLQRKAVLRAYHLPRGRTYSQLHDVLKAEGLVIYAGQGDLSKTLFRISTMGQVTAEDLNRLLQCFARLV